MPAATTCDGCGQALHEPLDLAMLRKERDDQKRKLIGAVAFVAVMLVVAFTFASAIGGFVLWTAPLAWAVWSFTRYRAIDRRLALSVRRFG